MSAKTKQWRPQRLQETSRHILRKLAQIQPTGPEARPIAHAIWAMAHDTVGTLTQGRTAAQAHALGRGMTERVTLWIPEMVAATGAPVACHAGCAWCCTMPVAVSPPEALLMAEPLRTHCAPEALADVTARLKAQAARMATLPLDAQAEANLPCARLTEGRCGVYEARPVACRTWTSPEAALCRQAQTHPWDATIRQVGPLMESHAAAQIGVTAGLLESGVSAYCLELHRAVLCALETPRAAERWAQGAPIFRHGKRMDSVKDTLDTILTKGRTAGRVAASSELWPTRR
jgi:hypothetical protein